MIIVVFKNVFAELWMPIGCYVFQMNLKLISLKWFWNFELKSNLQMFITVGSLLRVLQAQRMTNFMSHGAYLKYSKYQKVNSALSITCLKHKLASIVVA